jgi:hypothetical protein
MENIEKAYMLKVVYKGNPKEDLIPVTFETKQELEDAQKALFRSLSNPDYKWFLIQGVALKIEECASITIDRYYK